MVEAAHFVADLRVAWRQALGKPAVLVSSGLLLAIVFLLTVGLAVLQPYQLTVASAQGLLYGIAVFEILLGLRVGLLRLTGQDSDYAISKSGRFWRRSLPYLVPALLIPLPVAMLLATSLGQTGSITLIFIGFTTHYLAFFLAAVAITVLFRRITANLFARLALLFLSLLVVLLSLSSSDFVFREVFLFEKNGNQAIFLSILAHLSVTAIAAVIIEGMLGSLALRPRLFGRYWPLLRLSFLHGHGQGSSSFFQTNRLLLRDSRLQRRLAALLLGVLAVAAVAVVVKSLQAGYEFDGLIWRGLLLITSAAAAYSIAECAYARVGWVARQTYLPVSQEEVATGSWFSGLIWLLSFVLIVTGLLSSYLALTNSQTIVLIIAVVNQYILLFGWQGKLQQAYHQLTARTIVFLMAVTLGLVPLVMWELAAVQTIIITQLLWLLLTGALLAITRSAANEGRYA
ncbi:MAG: hypothetical protein WEC83_00140 [Patescibacteria group bacterium]